MEYELSGRIFDGTKFHENSSITFDSQTGKITRFGERGSFERPGNSRELIDYEKAKEFTILPGLIDAHVHFFGSTSEGLIDWATTPGPLAALRSVADLKRLLFAGFTSVRELGTKEGVHLAKAAEEGVFDSPTIISCSRALAQTGGDDDPSIFPLEISQQLASYSYFCDGPDDCRKAVRKVVRDGGRVIKIYASGSFAQGGRVRLQFTVEEIKSITDEAHRSGLKVAAHAYGEEALLNAIEGGVDSIEHGLGLTSKVASFLTDRGIYYVPTLVTYKTLKPSTNRAREEMIRKHLSEDLEIAKEHRVKVVTGSDIVGDRARPHGCNYEEIAAEAKFLGNEEALVAATSRAAECLDLEHSGAIAEGYVADIVVVKGDPISDIEALSPEKVFTVVKKGKIVRHEFHQST